MTGAIRFMGIVHGFLQCIADREQRPEIRDQGSGISEGLPRRLLFIPIVRQR